MIKPTDFLSDDAVEATFESLGGICGIAARLTKFGMADNEDAKERFKESVVADMNRIRGNRADNAPVSYADAKLIVIKVLQKCLNVLTKGD